MHTTCSVRAIILANEEKRRRAANIRKRIKPAAKWWLRLHLENFLTQRLGSILYSVHEIYAFIRRTICKHSITSGKSIYCLHRLQCTIYFFYT